MDLAIDIAVICPLRETYKCNLNAVDEYSRNQKHKEYDAGFVGTNIAFKAIVMDTFNGVNKEGVDILKVLSRRSQCRWSFRGNVKLRTRLQVAIQRHVSRMVLKRIQLRE